MTEPILSFTDATRVGKVASVDTSKVFVDVENHALLTRVSVGNLLAVQGTTAQEFLIGIVERVTRQMKEEALLEQEDEQGNVPIGESQTDVIMAVLVGTYRAIDGDKRNVFKRGADSFPQIDRSCFIIDAGNLQHLMGLLAKDVPEGQRLELGHYVADRSAIAVADGNRFFQRHAAILGSTGSGKSWAVALVLERAAALDHPNLIVLDMHGEYAPLSDPKGKPPGFARSFRIAGPGDLKSKADDVLFLPFWALNREEMLAMLLDRSDQNAPNQASRFTEHVRHLKDAYLEKAKKTDVRDTFTVDSPIPYNLSDLLEKLEEDDSGTKTGAGGKDVKGDWNGRLTRFIARLKSKMEDRRYGFLFHPPDEAMKYEWLAEQAVKLMASDGKNRGIKIIDFSGVPSDVLPVVVSVFARLIYNIQFWMAEDQRSPLTFVCDEAHLYLPAAPDVGVVELRAVEAFERIAKEGRKYGVSLLVVSQRPSDVSRTILSQCNNFLALRLTNDQDQAVVRRLMPDSMSGLTEILPLLDTGEALILGDSVLLPTRLKLSTPTIQPASATRNFWSDWAGLEPKLDTIVKAVESLRKQTR